MNSSSPSGLHEPFSSMPPDPDHDGRADRPVVKPSRPGSEPGTPEGTSPAAPGLASPDEPGTGSQRATPSQRTTSGDTPNPSADPFDPAKLRLSQNFLNTGGVRKHVTTVPTRKPLNEEWFQVRPDPDFVLDTLVLELKGSRECYLIAPALRNELAAERTVGPRRLHVAINRDGTVFIWPLKLPLVDGRQDRWSETAMEAAEVAKRSWVRIQADMALGAYVYDTPIGDLPSPQWPDMSLAQLLKLAFKNNYIEAYDHTVLRRLRGEV